MPLPLRHQRRCLYMSTPTRQHTARKPTTPAHAHQPNVSTPTTHACLKRPEKANTRQGAAVSASVEMHSCRETIAWHNQHCHDCQPKRCQQRDTRAPGPRTSHHDSSDSLRLPRAVDRLLRRQQLAQQLCCASVFALPLYALCCHVVQTYARSVVHDQTIPWL